MEFFEPYQMAIYAIGALAVLMFVQLLAADLIGIKNKHIPGASVATDHDNVLFRATRTVANTNESIAIFVLVFLFAVMSSADPVMVAYATWGFVLSRAVYALCYYTNRKALRSISFALSLTALAVLFMTGVMA